MLIAANSNYPPFGLFWRIHNGVRCLCCGDLRMLLDYCGGLGGDFYLGKVVG